MAAAPTRHICHLKNDEQKGKYPLVALQHPMIRQTEATMESKFMTCRQGGAAHGAAAWLQIMNLDSIVASVLRRNR